MEIKTIFKGFGFPVQKYWTNVEVVKAFIFILFKYLFENGKW